ncbi:MAG TPA: hypothetical protein VLI90_11560 [Tepidisphaeraceae bacterium]|nr:hypothetical protein [Tepidisphaeraceae bacterium]
MKSKRNSALLTAAAAAIALLAKRSAHAGLTFNVDPNSPWPAGWYNAAVADMQTVVNEYNAYGNFTQDNSGNIYVYYNAGIPTAQSDDNGSRYRPGRSAASAGYPAVPAGGSGRWPR